MNKRSTLILIFALTPVACGGAEKRPANPPDVPDVDAPSAPPESTSSRASDNAEVRISDEIRRACNIESHEAYFDYDSARIRSNQQAILRKLADCFSTGPLRGRTMALIGRADPRGDAEYNMVLGERRAASVASGLAAERLNRGQMRTNSRGEMDAVGGNEQGWALDRRVDIELAN